MSSVHDAFDKVAQLTRRPFIEKKDWAAFKRSVDDLVASDPTSYIYPLLKARIVLSNAAWCPTAPSGFNATSVLEQDTAATTKAAAQLLEGAEQALGCVEASWQARPNVEAAALGLACCLLKALALHRNASLLCHQAKIKVPTHFQFENDGGDLDSDGETASSTALGRAGRRGTSHRPERPEPAMFRDVKDRDLADKGRAALQTMAQAKVWIARAVELLSEPATAETIAPLPIVQLEGSPDPLRTVWDKNGMIGRSIDASLIGEDVQDLLKHQRDKFFLVHVKRLRGLTFLLSIAGPMSAPTEWKDAAHIPEMPYAMRPRQTLESDKERAAAASSERVQHLEAIFALNAKVGSIERLRTMEILQNSTFGRDFRSSLSTGVFATLGMGSISRAAWAPASLRSKINASVQREGNIVMVNALFSRMLVWGLWESSSVVLRPTRPLVPAAPAAAPAPESVAEAVRKQLRAAPPTTSLDVRPLTEPATEGERFIAWSEELTQKAQRSSKGGAGTKAKGTTTAFAAAAAAAPVSLFRAFHKDNEDLIKRTREELQLKEDGKMWDRRFWDGLSDKEREDLLTVSSDFVSLLHENQRVFSNAAATTSGGPPPATVLKATPSYCCWACASLASCTAETPGVSFPTLGALLEHFHLSHVAKKLGGVDTWTEDARKYDKLSKLTDSLAHLLLALTGRLELSEGSPEGQEAPGTELTEASNVFLDAFVYNVSCGACRKTQIWGSDFGAEKFDRMQGGFFVAPENARFILEDGLKKERVGILCASCYRAKAAEIRLASTMGTVNEKKLYEDIYREAMLNSWTYQDPTARRPLAEIVRSQFEAIVNDTVDEVREGGLADAGPPAPREMAAAKIVAHASEMELPGIVPILARIAGDVRVAASSFWDEPKPPATGALEAAMKEVEDGLKDLAAAAERWGVTIKDRDRERAQERVREILQSLRRAIELCCALRPEDTIQPVTSTYSYFSGFTEPRGYKALCELDVVERERDGAREKRSFFTKLYGEEAAAKDVVIELRAHFAVLRLVTTEEKHPAVGKLRTQAAHLFKPGGLELPLRVVRAMLSASLPYGWNPKPTKDVVGIDALDADGSERSTAPLRDAAAVRELVDRLVPQRPVGMRPFLQLADDGVRLADRWLEEDVGAVCAAKGLDRPAAVFLWLSGELQDAHEAYATAVRMSLDGDDSAAALAAMLLQHATALARLRAAWGDDGAPADTKHRPLIEAIVERAAKELTEPSGRLHSAALTAKEARTVVTTLIDEVGSPAHASKSDDQIAAELMRKRHPLFEFDALESTNPAVIVRALRFVLQTVEQREAQRQLKEYVTTLVVWAGQMKRAYAERELFLTSLRLCITKNKSKVSESKKPPLEAASHQAQTYVAQMTAFIDNVSALATSHDSAPACTLSTANAVEVAVFIARRPSAQDNPYVSQRKFAQAIARMEQCLTTDLKDFDINETEELLASLDRSSLTPDAKPRFWDENAPNYVKPKPLEVSRSLNALVLELLDERLTKCLAELQVLCYNVARAQEPQLLYRRAVGERLQRLRTERETAMAAEAERHARKLLEEEEAKKRARAAARLKKEQEEREAALAAKTKTGPSIVFSDSDDEPIVAPAPRGRPTLAMSSSEDEDEDEDEQPEGAEDLQTALEASLAKFHEAEQRALDEAFRALASAPATPLTPAPASASPGPSPAPATASKKKRSRKAAGTKAEDDGDDWERAPEVTSTVNGLRSVPVCPFQPTRMHRADPGVVVLSMECVWKCPCGAIHRPLMRTTCSACLAPYAPCREYTRARHGLALRCPYKDCRYLHARVALCPALAEAAVKLMGSQGTFALEKDVLKNVKDVPLPRPVVAMAVTRELRPRPTPAAVAAVAVEPSAAQTLSRSAASSLAASPASLAPMASVSAAAVASLSASAVAMRNEEGEYNCFLNVLIQSLWHLRDFRTVMLSPAGAPPPGHEEEAAVLQALRQIFASIDRKEKAQGRVESKEEGEALLAPTNLRDALSARFGDAGLFKQGEMNDAAEALQSILDCLDRAEGERPDSWVRRLFALNLHHEMNCSACGMKSLQKDWTQLCEQVQAFEVRRMGLIQTLRAERESDKRSCDREARGCGTINHVVHSLAPPMPRLYTVMVSWDSPFPSAEEVAQTARAIGSALEIKIKNQIYRGLLGVAEGQTGYRLRAMICYYGLHYMAYARAEQDDAWVFFNDVSSRRMGSFTRVTDHCIAGKHQPVVLLYEKTV